MSFGCSQTLSPSSHKLPSKEPGRYVEKMDSGGIGRSYILRVPKAYDASKPLPLVIVLHGWTASAVLAEAYTGMGAESDREGFIMVAPDGLGSNGMQGWNAGFIDLSGKGADDVAFINSLIDKVVGEVGVDPDRIFIAGHSNGAFMANYLGAKLSKRIAAIGSVAGTVGVPDPESTGGYKMIPQPSEPLSVILIHGKKDPMVQFEKNSQALLHDVPAMDSAKFWAKNDGCVLTPLETKSPNGNVVTTTFPNGKSGTEVTLVAIGNGVHDWPGGLNRRGQETTTGVNAADLIWKFFQTHPKRH